MLMLVYSKGTRVPNLSIEILIYFYGKKNPVRSYHRKILGSPEVCVIEVVSFEGTFRLFIV